MRVYARLVPVFVMAGIIALGCNQSDESGSRPKSTKNVASSGDQCTLEVEGMT